MTQKDPRDGISDLSVEFDGLDNVALGGGSAVRFRIAKGGNAVAVLHFHVREEEDGLTGQMSRACRMLEDGLRQMTLHAETLGAHYRGKSA